MSTPPVFKWRHFQAEIILLNVRWYCPTGSPNGQSQSPTEGDPPKVLSHQFPTAGNKLQGLDSPQQAVITGVFSQLKLKLKK